jgi:D-3-phosphoglycerate dehydrogenase
MSERRAERGITVCFTQFNPDSTHATPELAWGLILAAARNIAQEDHNVRTGKWQASVGTTLHGKTLGLFGLGRIGRRMAEIGRAFGMSVIAWSQNLTKEAAAAAGARRVDKATLLRESDVLSVHVVLSERTTKAIGTAELGLMKPTAILINTSRGQIIDEAALVDALRNRRIAMAGLDVFCDEPLPADSPLPRLPNTILTPHLGFVVREAYGDFSARRWRISWPTLAVGPCAFLSRRGQLRVSPRRARAVSATTLAHPEARGMRGRSAPWRP